MLTCNLGANKINCFDGSYTRDQLKMWSKKGILLCEACGKPYEYCHGRVIPPYFRHKDKNLCEDKYSEVETEEHIQGKRDLYEWIKKQDGVTNVELEAWIPETKQRPDIMFKYNGQKCVIEYQCSPIATEYYERHELYQAAGIKDVWICGTEKYLQDGMREKTILKECKLLYDSNNKCMYFDIGSIYEFNYYDLRRCDYYSLPHIHIEQFFNRIFEVVDYNHIDFKKDVVNINMYKSNMQSNFSKLKKLDDFCNSIKCAEIKSYFNKTYYPLDIITFNEKEEKTIRIYYSLCKNHRVVVSDDYNLRKMYTNFNMNEVYDYIDECAKNALALINTDLLKYYTFITNYYVNINSIFDLWFSFDHRNNSFEMHCDLKRKYCDTHYCNFIAFSIDRIIDMHNLNKIVNENMNKAICQWESENKVRFMEVVND